MLRLILAITIFASVALFADKPVAGAVDIVFAYSQTNGISGEYKMSLDYEDVNYYASWCVTQHTFDYSVPWYNATWDDVIWIDSDDDNYYAVVVTNKCDFPYPDRWYRFGHVVFHPSFYLSENNLLWVEPITVVYENGKHKKLKNRKD